MKKSTSKIYSHFIDATKHAHFLEQKRQDSITHEIIREGDEVVFCSVCKSAFTVDSWEYIGRSHCYQSQTLKKVPMLRSLSLDRKKIEKRKKIAFYKKYSGGMVIAFFIVIGTLGMLTMAVDMLTSPAKNMTVQGISITEKHYLNNGKKQYQAQNYTEAENYYIKVLNINPSNTEALHFLEQLENEYLLALEEADHFFKSQKYTDAKYWYRKAVKYKPNAEYPTQQLLLITQAEAERPVSFVPNENLNENNSYSLLKEYPKEWAVFINPNEQLHFWVTNLQKTEVLLSYESGLVELRSLEVDDKIDEDEDKKTETGKLLNTFKGAKMPQATFIYPELFLKEFENLTEEEKDEIQKDFTFNYKSIAVINKGSKIYYYTLDKRGARQVSQFSTFHYKKNEIMILSEDGRYFMTQTPDKILHLYDARSKTLIKSLGTNEHKPFVGNAYFDLENNQIVAQTTEGESRWNISN